MKTKKNPHREFRTIKTKSLEWVDLCNPTRQNMKILQKRFSFHDLDIEDCLSPMHVSKVDNYEHYIFMVLLFPVYKKSNSEIISTEIDFFIGKDYVITIHKSEIQTMDKFFNKCSESKVIQKELFAKNPAKLIYHVLDQLFAYEFPMIEHIHHDIKLLERKIFNGYERETVHDILYLKRNIINYRKAIQLHKGMIRRFIIKAETFFPISPYKVYFDNLIEHTKDIWDTLEIQKENIDALHATNESLISFRLNDIMKFLTIISVIMLPGALIAGIFGVNALHTPIIGQPNDFWMILGIMVSVSLTMILIFKRKK